MPYVTQLAINIINSFLCLDVILSSYIEVTQSLCCPWLHDVITLCFCNPTCARGPSSYSSSSVTNFHPLQAVYFLFPFLLSFSSVIHSLIVFCPLSNFLFIWPLCVCVCVSMSSFLPLPPCVAFSVISQGSVIFWGRCGWWVGQKHVQLSSMETRWMMIRGYVCLAPAPFNRLIQSGVVAR